jgi:hypothetical protein
MAAERSDYAFYTVCRVCSRRVARRARPFVIFRSTYRLISPCVRISGDHMIATDTSESRRVV